jgi:hypothetical protein
MLQFRRLRAKVTRSRIALALIPVLLLVPSWIAWDGLQHPRNAAETVERFFNAILDKDVDEALKYLDLNVVDDPPPHRSRTIIDTGRGTTVLQSETAFLHPDAIADDWHVLEVREELPKWMGRVTVVIGHEGGTATGTIHTDPNDHTIITEGLGKVRFAASTYGYARVNDHVAETEPESSARRQLYALLPGVYRFGPVGGETAPVAVLPSNMGSAVVPAPAPDTGPEATTAVQLAVEELIDGCTASRDRVPDQCPFGTDGKIDSVEHGRVRRADNFHWRLVEYPEVALRTSIEHDRPRLRVDFSNPGRIELTGSGDDSADERVEFTAHCRFDDRFLLAFLNADGTASVHWTERGDGEHYIRELFDSCRGTD